MKIINKREKLSNLRRENMLRSSCPTCSNLIENWDTSFMNTWGVCSNCYIDYIKNSKDIPENIVNPSRNFQDVIDWINSKK